MVSLWETVTIQSGISNRITVFETKNVLGALKIPHSYEITLKLNKLLPFLQACSNQMGRLLCWLAYSFCLELLPLISLEETTSHLTEN